MDIGVWGDSIVYGEGDRETLGWVGRVRKTVPDSIDTLVYNRGVCGDTTSGLLQRFSVEFASLKPEVVIFAIGINDSLFRTGATAGPVSEVAVEDTKQNLRQLVAQAGSAKVLFVGLTPVTDELVNPLTGSSSGKCYSNEQVQKYDAAIAEVAAELNVPYISVFDALTDTDLADGLHPNAQGYEKLFVRIASYLTNNAYVTQAQV